MNNSPTGGIIHRPSRQHHLNFSHSVCKGMKKCQQRETIGPIINGEVNGMSFLDKVDKRE